MKNYISKATLALLVALSATGCSDFLDEKLKSELAPDNTYTSSYGFEVGSTGLYAEARSEYNTWGENGAFMHNAACPYEALQIATDLATMGTKDGSIQPFGFLTLTPNTGIVGSYWNWAYSLIAGANEMLKYSEINTNWDNSTDKALYQAESRFFRAYAYRTLVYLYGDVPYVDKIQDQFRIDFTRTPKEEVIAHMVEDLQFAVENLPTDPDAVKVGKLTKWAAEHLLSDGFVLADSLGGRGLSQLVPMKWWIGEDTGFFDEEDIRNSEYNIKRNWYYNNENMPDLYGKKATITDETWFTTFRLYPALTKFFYGRSENLSLTGSYRDRMKFRLSETYLLLCEARLGLNDISGAREAINVVRRRAHAPEITDSEMTMDFLLDERIRELVGEESRRFTLCRTGKLLERTRKYNTESGPVMRDYHTLWPIPQSIIDSNTGAEFPQNEGY